MSNSSLGNQRQRFKIVVFDEKVLLFVKYLGVKNCSYDKGYDKETGTFAAYWQISCQ